MFINRFKSAILFLVVVIVSPSLLASELSGANTSWILTSTALVLFMTIPGLSLFYAGLVRSKNTLSVLMQCFAICCGASIVWFAVGYSLAFSEGNSFVGGLSKAFFAGIEEDTLSGDLPETLFAMFQMTFAIITPALIVGAFAERMKFSAMMIFSMVWLIVVYAPVCHWVWGGGWLGHDVNEAGELVNIGVLDFAGGIVVHITAGVAALVAAIVIGNRKGYGKTPMPPHSLPMTVTGAGMLWVGWFGFNAGSALAANGDAAMAMLVTHISAAAGSLAWMTIEWIRYGKPSVLGIVTGMVAGLGTITPASGFVGPGGALLIGLSAGVVCYFATQLIKNKLKIDDSLDVFPVHGVGGILGTFLVAFFASDAIGLLSGQGYNDGVTTGAQLIVQLKGIFAAIIYTAVVSWVLLKILDKVIGLRVSEEEEIEGLDVALHGERAYES